MPRDKKFIVRASGVHGKGVFAARDLEKGERIIEYKGERITWEQALKRHPHNPLEPNHTFFIPVARIARLNRLKLMGNSAYLSRRAKTSAQATNCFTTMG
jgi:SET domain-containing protein